MDFSQEELKRLVNILYQIVAGSDELAIFRNSISVGEVSSNGNFICTGKLKIKQLRSNSTNHSMWSDDGQSFSVIRIANFSPRDINHKTLFTGQTENDESRYYFSNLYGKWTKETVASRIGLNVCKKVSIKGYMLNFNDVRRLLTESFTTRRYEQISDYINEFYYMGTRNYLIGINSTNGILYIREQALIKLLKYNDDDTVKKCLTNMFYCFSKFYNKFMELNIREYKEEAAEILQQNVLNKIVNDKHYGRNYHSRSETDPDIFMTEVKKYIKDKLTSNLKGTIFGIKDSYSYGKILNDILTTRRNKEKEIFKQGFSKGMQIGLKFEMIGWRPSSPNFADEYEKHSMWWEKEVDITPDMFIHSGKRYLIPEKNRKFHIKKLYVNQNGKMKCDGNHPNVSGSSVCMGDLSIKFNEDISDIQEVLYKVETLLDLINYDSAYHYEDMDKLLKVSTPVDMLNNVFDAPSKKAISKIRELGSNDDDGDEEEIEETNDENMVFVDESGQVIAEQFTLPVSDDDISNINNHNSFREVIETIDNESERGLPTYIVNEADIAQDINYVDQNGERRPTMFVMGNGTEPHRGELLTLGDSNLVRRTSENV